MRGQLAVVTGGTRGIGAAISRRLAARGVHVVAVHRSDIAAAEALRDEVIAGGHSLSLLRTDLGSAEACREAIASVQAEYGQVDYLVNNAGILVENRVPDVTVAEWDSVLATNLGAPFFLVQAVWPGMVERGFGRIVNIGSVTAFTGNPVEAAYGASKAGLTGLTRSLALAGARKGITVNCVVPGVYETDMTRSMKAEHQERIAAMIPLGRLGRPEELAHAVQFLLDDDGGYVTGTTIMVDGGIGLGN